MCVLKCASIILLMMLATPQTTAEAVLKQDAAYREFYHKNVEMFLSEERGPANSSAKNPAAETDLSSIFSFKPPEVQAPTTYWEQGFDAMANGFELSLWGLHAYPVANKGMQVLRWFGSTDQAAFPGVGFYEAIWTMNQLRDFSTWLRSKPSAPTGSLYTEADVLDMVNKVLAIKNQENKKTQDELTEALKQRDDAENRVTLADAGRLGADTLASEAQSKLAKNTEIMRQVKQTNEDLQTTITDQKARIEQLTSEKQTLNETFRKAADKKQADAETKCTSAKNALSDELAAMEKAREWYQTVCRIMAMVHGVLSTVFMCTVGIIGFSAKMAPNLFKMLGLLVFYFGLCYFAPEWGALCAVCVMVYCAYKQRQNNHKRDEAMGSDEKKALLKSKDDVEALYIETQRKLGVKTAELKRMAYKLRQSETALEIATASKTV
jgi:hypothetical protein